MTIKVYHLYPTGSRYSTRVNDYCGTVVAVAATSIRQAYALAYNKRWIDPDARYPIGVVSIHHRDGITLWCGCSGHHLGFGVEHMDGVTALRQAIADHYKTAAHQRFLADNVRRLTNAAARTESARTLGRELLLFE